MSPISSLKEKVYQPLKMAFLKRHFVKNTHPYFVKNVQRIAQRKDGVLFIGIDGYALSLYWAYKDKILVFKKAPHLPLQFETIHIHKDIKEILKNTDYYLYEHVAITLIEMGQAASEFNLLLSVAMGINKHLDRFGFSLEEAQKLYDQLLSTEDFFSKSIDMGTSGLENTGECWMD